MNANVSARLLYARRLVLEDVLNGPEQSDGSTPRVILASVKMPYDLQKRRIRGFRRSAWIVLGIAVFATLTICGQGWLPWPVEPLSFSSGTSIWPALMIRATGLAVALCFFCWVMSFLDGNIYEISNEFCLPVCKRRRSPLTWNSVFSREPWKLAFFWQVGRGATADELWKEYQRLGQWSMRFRRVLPSALLFFMMACGLFLANGTPYRPFRGIIAGVADILILFAFVLLYIGVTFFVMDAIRLCRRFVSKLNQAATRWSPVTYERFRKERSGLEDAYLEEWVEMRLIAERTEAIERLIYLPFILLAISLIARSEFFDHWSWPWPLIAVMFLNACLAAYSLIVLKVVARRARCLAISNLQKKLWEAQLEYPEGIRPRKDAVAAIEKIKQTIEDIRKLKTGAFKSLFASHIVQALFLSSGGYVLIQIALKAVFAPHAAP